MQAAPAPAPGYWSAPGSAQDSEVERNRRAVVTTLEDFFTTVGTGSEAEFRRHLSSRSIEFLRTYDPNGEVWSIAKQALGSIGNRRIQFLGGRADSAAVLVSGLRASEDTVLPASIILSVLREDGHWKVMYPGAQPLDEHVGP